MAANVTAIKPQYVRAASRVPHRAPGASGRDGGVQPFEVTAVLRSADGGADALQERRLVRWRGVHGHAAGLPQGPAAGDGGAGSRLLRGAAA